MSDLKPAQLSHPLLNSIPPHLIDRFDPTYVKYHTHYAAGRLAGHQVPIEAYRKDPSAYNTRFGKAPAPDANVGVISDEQLQVTGPDGQITIRVYQPKTTQIDNRHGRPIYVNFHGGGWVFGDHLVEAEHCKRIVHETGAVAFDVGYRHAPEFPFPTPVDDCWQATQWILSPAIIAKYNLDVARTAVGGPSAGGHLSAVVSQRARDAGIKLVLQLLHVPVCDMDHYDESGKLSQSVPYKSHVKMYETVPLSGARMEYFARHFLGVPRRAETYNNPSVSPIRAADLSNLAPALITTAEMDPLCSEGEAYHKKLLEAGNQSEYHMLRGMPHIVAGLDDICDEAKRYNVIIVEALKKAYGII
ncbi:esterase [Pseudovirgaria hyperparasitica]|uniref:Esterase n=1 Tax=Pseudovirgaria hyperparasitica TaxID=470096 RepID=A0A6A6VWD8_9PEZI|nr:esterase [Pseudovirgaria hyperparasitica]KAF2754902.1 esterase [Pseudovirgaria hyperparasitica]